MTKVKQEIAKDIHFIFDEVRRFRNMGKAVFKEIEIIDVLCTLPHPSGTGRMLCGQAAHSKVAAIARKAAEKANIIDCITSHTLRKAAEVQLVQRFYVNQRPVNERQIDKLFSAITSEVEKTCSDKTQFVPCLLMTAKQPNSFVIGPVTFRNSHSFWRRVRPYLHNYAQGEDPEQREHMRSMVADAVKHYRNFNWIAEITVSGCDRDTSAQVAERTTQSAVNALHLIFRARYKGQMRVSGPVLKTDRRAGLTLKPSGSLQPHGSIYWGGAAGFPRDWSKWLETDHVANIVKLFGTALQTEVNPRLKRPVSRRFLDAARWFGEATIDERPSSALIKFVTALERLVMTGEKNEISNHVADRVSALCCSIKDGDRDQWRQNVVDVYDMRSRILHGATSPFDKAIVSAIPTAAKLGEECIVHAIQLLGNDALEAERVTVKRLRKWYKDVLAHFANASDVIAPEEKSDTTK